MFENKNNKNKVSCKILSYIALAIPLICIFLFVNYFMKIIPFIKFGTISSYFSLYTAPVGIVISLIASSVNKDGMSKLALILNAILLIIQVIFIAYGIVFMLK